MCGIFCCISKTLNIHSCIKNSMLRQLLQNRGPNAERITEFGNATFGGFILWHQGVELSIQPLESDSHLLLFNGDIFNITNSELQGISDSKWIFEKLTAANNEDEIISTFKNIEGPYSIIFYNKVDKTLYFARDSLGRNSLLIENSNEHFRLLSTSYNNNIKNNTMELPPLGIYKFNNDDFLNCILFPWRLPDDDYFAQIKTLKRCNIEINIKHHVEHQWSMLLNEFSIRKYSYNFYDMANVEFSTTSELYDLLLNNDDVFKAINEFANLLSVSVKKRVQYTTKYCSLCLKLQKSCTHSKVAILFSGGIDCSILAVLTDKFIPKSDSIDLINVAFESTRTNNGWDVPDRISAKSSLENLFKLCPESN